MRLKPAKWDLYPACSKVFATETNVFITFSLFLASQTKFFLTTVVTIEKTLAMFCLLSGYGIAYEYKGRRNWVMMEIGIRTEHWSKPFPQNRIYLDFDQAYPVRG